MDDIDQLSRDGFHWIIQKVIFKVGKVRFSPFSHNDWYYSIVTKCCPHLLHHVASLLWNQSCPKILKVWNHSKIIFKVRKVQFGPLWSISANISETVHRMMKVCMKHSRSSQRNYQTKRYPHFTRELDQIPGCIYRWTHNLENSHKN